MPKQLSFQVSPEIAANAVELQRAIASKLGLSSEEIKHFEVLKKSIDARQRSVKLNIRAEVYFLDDEIFIEKIDLPEYKNVSTAQHILIIGAGPAGLFAALKLIEIGLKPIILERGKDVKSRRRDLKAINRDHIVDEDSNYCFGEGGAGTYSDGKLYTRSKKRGDVDRILKLLVAFGATPEILVDAHPHIGTNKLPKIIEDIRDKIIECGGEVHFDKRVIEFLILNNQITGAKTLDGTFYESKKIILATGHSARDIYELLDRQKIFMEAKPFAIGVRAEHPQALIDKIQYKCESRGEFLPPSPYSIVKQVNGRGIYSFCMCPGGVIAPCATSLGEVVTNGWSPSKRDQPTANSGIVVELKLSDFSAYAKYGALAGMHFQKETEQKSWQLAGRTQKVPAQKMVDFVNKKISGEIPKTSYVPGTESVALDLVFPEFITNILRQGFTEFGKIMPGYFTNEAILHAPESRTSSPVRIPRDAITLEHLQIKGLYPCGEGAGHAGGIVSAAIDGENCAVQIGISLAKK